MVTCPTAIRSIWSTWLIVYISLIIMIDCQLTDVNGTNLDYDDITTETVNGTDLSEFTFPKVQSRFFRWLFNGLSGQPSPNGGGMFTPNAAGLNALFNGQGGSPFGSMGGFGQLAQSAMGQQSNMRLPGSGSSSLGSQSIPQLGQFTNQLPNLMSSQGGLNPNYNPSNQLSGPMSGQMNGQVNSQMNDYPDTIDGGLGGMSDTDNIE